MNPQKEKAGASTPAMKNKLSNKSYPKTILLSSLTNHIKELLVLLAGNEPSEEWQRFERLVCQFCEGGVL